MVSAGTGDAEVTREDSAFKVFVPIETFVLKVM